MTFKIVRENQEAYEEAVRQLDATNSNAPARSLTRNAEALPTYINNQLSARQDSGVPVFCHNLPSDTNRRQRRVDGPHFTAHSLRLCAE